MRITDPRLYKAEGFDDFFFRLRWDEIDNVYRRGSLREVAGLTTPFVAPDTNKIWGPDVSDWDGEVDWKIARDYGARFGIIKAMDGTIPTKYWAANHKHANEIGLPHGPYAWLYPDNRVNCTLQARAYYNLIDDEEIQLPPAVDFEWTRYAGVQVNPNYTDLRKWAAEFNRLSRVKPVLYSAAGYMNMFGSMPADLRDMFDGFWWASYPRLSFPMGFTTWDMHQFTASGDAQTICPGNRGKLELDLNYMTQAFHDKHISGETFPPTEPPEDPMRYTATALSDGTRLRSSHDTTLTPVGSYPRGTEFHGDLIWEPAADVWREVNGVRQMTNMAGDKWLSVSEIGGLTRVGWVAIKHMGVEICSLRDNAPPAAKTPFTLTVQGYKLFNGELEKE